MISNRLLQTAALCTALACAAPASAAPGDTDTITGTTRAVVANPLTITNTTDLAFGVIFVPTTGFSQVTVQARSGARSLTTNTNVSTGAFGPARFIVTGPASTRFGLTSAANTIQLNGPGAPMTVRNLRVSFNSTAQRGLPRSFTLPASGTAPLAFGGQLRIPAGQTPGQYSGTFTIIVTHQ